MTRNTMLTEDYLIRLINQALAALAAVVGLRTAGQYLEARALLDQMLEQLFGLRSDLIKRLDDPSLLDALTNQEVLDTDRVCIAADLFKEQGNLFAAQNNAAESYLSYLRAFNFYLEVALAGGPRHFPPPDEKIEALYNLLQGFDLPFEILFSLYAYREQSGNYARAAGLLLRMAAVPGVSQEILEEQRDFYHRLLEKPDNELLEGGLSRPEIQKRLAEIGS